MSTDLYPDRKPTEWSLLVHASALLALTVSGAILLYPQFKSVRRSDMGRSANRGAEFGWPLIHRVTYVQGTGYLDLRMSQSWDMTALAVNVATLFVLVGGAGIGAARLAHDCHWPPKYSLASLLELTLVVAVVLSVVLAYRELVQMLKIAEPRLLPVTALVACGLALLAVKPIVQFALRLLKGTLPR